ncbi:MFS transporter [Actinomycetospora chibensis]|uniref:MFS transporter n=1 Tax=Actinomycetospora chibensis TaxID=663606 RepID=A0ABV9RK64_9PSEU|nr:MFS transporter [Actinomycetospora chibensis]MDD7924695.1 MFS transporter [Actinomycetospora chibensis]
MSAPAGEVSPQRWLVLVAMTGSLSMIMLDQTVVSVALPTMGRDLSLSPGAQQWVVNAYVLALAALVALGGKAADLLGPRRAFRSGVSLFFLASVGCGLAPAGEFGEATILACRTLQGAGAALMVPVSGAIVIASFGPGERGRAMAIFAGISQIFVALGPLIGGLLTEYVSWRAVFFLNVPVGIATLVLVAIAPVPAARVPGAAVRPLDVLLVVAGLAATTFGIQLAGTDGLSSPLVPALLVGGLAATGWFVVRQVRAADPLIHVRLFTDRAFTGDAAVMGFVQFGLLGLVLYSSIYLQELLGFGPMAAGLAVLPLILPLTVAAQLGGRWFDRAGVRGPVITGLVLCAVGTVLWLLALPGLEYALQTPGMALVGIGLGLTLSPTNTDALARVGVSERTQASGVVQTVRQLGGTLGVAVIGAVVIAADGETPGQTAAPSGIAAGFWVAAVAFALAALVGATLLARRDTPVPTGTVKLPASRDPSLGSG